MKKVITIVVVTVLMLALVPVVALADAGDWSANGEGSVSGTTVFLSWSRPDISQPVGMHGASLELPPADSYQVTFDYDLHTWDAYTLTGTGCIGYWDSFSISVAQDKYWDLPLTDPINTDPDIGSLGYGPWGGMDYCDGILESTIGTGATATMTGDPTQTNYLNIMLDTATLNAADTAHASYGEVELTGLSTITTVDLIADGGDEYIDVGDLTVTSDGTDLSIVYTTVAGWEMDVTHLYVDTTCPTKIAPGKFPYAHEDLGWVTSDSYNVPSPVDITLEYCIAAQAEVRILTGYDLEGNPIYRYESAWAEGEQIRPGKNWAMCFKAWSGGVPQGNVQQPTMAMAVAPASQR